MTGIGQDIVTVWRKIVNRAAIGCAANHAAPGFCDIEPILDLGADHLRAQLPAVTHADAGKIRLVIHTQAVFPGAQGIEVGINRFHRSVWIYAVKLLQQIKCHGRVLQPGGDFSVQAKCCSNTWDTNNIPGHSIARITVGQHDQRLTTTKQAGAAPYRQPVSSCPVKTETRHGQFVSVQVKGIVKAVARSKSRVAGDRAAVIVFFKTHTEFQGQIIAGGPFILDKKAVGGQGEYAYCVRDHTAGRISVEHKPPFPVSQCLQAAKEQDLSACKWYKGIGGLFLFALITNGQNVVAN